MELLDFWLLQLNDHNITREFKQQQYTVCEQYTALFWSGIIQWNVTKCFQAYDILNLSTRRKAYWEDIFFVHGQNLGSLKV